MAMTRHNRRRCLHLYSSIIASIKEKLPLEQEQLQGTLVWTNIYNSLRKIDTFDMQFDKKSSNLGLVWLWSRIKDERILQLHHKIKESNSERSEYMLIDF